MVEYKQVMPNAMTTMQTSTDIQKQINNMRQKLKLLIVLIIIGQTVLAQQKLPIIRASSDTVDIRDGDNFNKAGWTISPKTRPDIYTTSNKNKKSRKFYHNFAPSKAIA